MNYPLISSKIPLALQTLEYKKRYNCFDSWDANCVFSFGYKNNTIDYSDLVHLDSSNTFGENVPYIAKV